MTPALTTAAPPVNWALRTPAGSFAEYVFTFLAADGATPYDITGAAWEYVVRLNATDTGTPLISVTATASASGLLTVSTSPASAVSLTLYPAATQSLQAGSYAHCLWMDPGTSAAFAWLTGSLIVMPASQP